MGWREMLGVAPTPEPATQNTQYPQNPQPGGNSEDIEHFEYGPPAPAGDEPWTPAEVEEAAEERAAIMEEAGERPADAQAVANLARDYYAHLFQQAGCCHPRAGNLCPKGKALRDAYHAACDARPGHDYRAGLSNAQPPARKDNGRTRIL